MDKEKIKDKIRIFCNKFTPFPLNICIQYESKKNKNAKGEIFFHGKEERGIILYRKGLKTDIDFYIVLAHEIGHHHIQKVDEKIKNRSLYEAGAQIWAIKRAYELNKINLSNELDKETFKWKMRPKNDRYKRASKICRPLLKLFNESSFDPNSPIPKNKDILILERFLRNNFLSYGANNVTTTQ